MNMAASSSSSIPSEKYDVFLSFRGEDTRYQFTSHLHAALCRKNIKIYIDNYDLNRGEATSSGLLKGIEESRIAVVIFSKNYANSRWCLDVLLHILQCRKNYGRVVIPIFYHVDPSAVRKQLGAYEEAFQNLRERFKNDADKVQKWIRALAEAGNLSGWTVGDDRSESQLVEAIVEDIIKKLNGMSLVFVDSQKLVGIEQPVNEIKSLLQLGLLGVHVIGLWGQGGIGKTTLARFMLGKLYHEFDCHCFLDNVREEWKKPQGNYHLKNKLFAKLLGEKETNTDIGFLMPKSWMERLRRTKSMIVLDDVNEREQLENLVGCRKWFGPGSRIIVTSRDVQLLQGPLVDAIHEVKGLNSDEARQLFCSNALERNPHVPYPAELLERVVHYAEGIPLVLNVLRSVFNNNGKQNWETLLNNLKNSCAGEKIQSALMISYNDLSKSQTNVFLDIASFFKGWNRHHVEEILEEHGFSVESAISDLVNKSLITINYEQELCMHDLVQEMGLEVIRKQSSNLGERSRLWDAQDIYHVFKSNTATSKIEGIFLDSSKIKEVLLKPDVFRQTHNLRLLKIYDSTNSFGGGNCCKVNLPEGLQYLPDKLQYFYWKAYPAKSLPQEFAPEMLVELIMTNSRVKRLWKGVQNLWSLRTINLSHSKKLTKIPNLSGAPNLETIDFSWCPRLSHVPSRKFQNLKRLVSLKMSCCDKLQVLPDSILSAKHLHFGCCDNLKKFPEIEMKNVIDLWLMDSKIEELPASIWSSYNLRMLILTRSKRLKNLPSSICQLTNLEQLNLTDCLSFEKLPELLPKRLKYLRMRGTAIEEVPRLSLESLSDLREFDVKDCKRLQSLPVSICKLKFLWQLDLSGCTNFEKFPEILETMEYLEELDLSETAIRELPASIENLIKLRELNLRLCEKLEFVPGNIHKVERLEMLNLSGTSKLLKSTSLTVGRFFNSRILNLLDCNISEFPHNWHGCFELVEALLIRIENLDAIPASITRFSNLQYLYICGWKNLRSLPEFLCYIKVLEAVGCTSLESVSSSMNAIMQDFHDNHVSFFNCLKLDQNACDNIIAVGRLRILCTAIHTSLKPGGLRQSYICYPGSEIPEWFYYQETGSSVNIKLPSNWWAGGFLGFSICLVAIFEEDEYFSEGLCLDVEVQLKNNSGESCKSERHWIPDFCYECKGYATSVSLDHVFMLYESTSFNKVWEVEEGTITAVSFHFHPTNRFHETLRLESCRVKRCGIRLLYLQDAEELGVSIPPNNLTPETESHRKRRTINGNANPCSSEIVLRESATEIEKGQGKRKKINENANLHDSATEKEGDHEPINKSEISESGFTIGSEEIMTPTLPPLWASTPPLMDQNQKNLQYHQQTENFSLPLDLSVPHYQTQMVQYSQAIMPPGLRLGYSEFLTCKRPHRGPSSSTQFASVDSTFQARHANGDDWQEEVYQEQGQLSLPNQVQCHEDQMNFHFPSINAQCSTATMHQSYIPAALPGASTTQHIIRMNSRQQQILWYPQMVTPSLPPRFSTHPMVPPHPYDQRQMLQYPQLMMPLSPPLLNLPGFTVQQPDEGPSSSTQYWSDSAAPDLNGTAEGLHSVFYWRC